MMPLAKVTDMRLERSVPGRMLNYGEFVIESAGQEQALRNVPFLPFPRDMYLVIMGMIFPSSPSAPPPPPPPAFVITAMHDLLVGAFGEHDTDAALWGARRQAQLLADLAGS
jgi:hypothetical protein